MNWLPQWSRTSRVLDSISLSVASSFHFNSSTFNRVFASSASSNFLPSSIRFLSSHSRETSRLLNHLKQPSKWNHPSSRFGSTIHDHGLLRHHCQKTRSCEFHAMRISSHCFHSSSHQDDGGVSGGVAPNDKPHNEGVDLFSVEFTPPSSSSSSSSSFSLPPLLILHGLLGSSNNWRSMATRPEFHSHHQRRVIAVESRNHGNSPHTKTMKIVEMATDLIRFVERDERNKNGVVAMGHSMVSHTHTHHTHSHIRTHRENKRNTRNIDSQFIHIQQQLH